MLFTMQFKQTENSEKCSDGELEPDLQNQLFSTLNTIKKKLALDLKY